MKNYLKQYLTDREENNQICIGGASAKTDKTHFETGSGTFGTNHSYEYPEKFIDKSSAINDSLKADSTVTLTYIVGDCPHCRQPLKVFTMEASLDVWIQCPIKPEIFKALYQESRDRCRDCEMKKPVICGRCAECVQRLMLAPDEPCAKCGGLRFWRHRASREKPAGFLWRCMNCVEPTGKVAVYEIEGGL